MSSYQFVFRLLLALASTALVLGCSPLDVHFRDPGHAQLAAAGIVEKNVTLGEVTFNYGEGPDNGPPLLLLHAQHLDWYSYSRVLPELSRSFHVFAVSYHGHGKTSSPAERFNAEDIGSDLAEFIQTVVGGPTFVTGNSSGGLLTTWLAARRPDLVRAILLEDPPLFTAEYPRSQKTIAYRTFTTCHDYLTNGSGDFLSYWLNSNKAFLAKRAGDRALPFVLSSIAAYRKANPDTPVELNFAPDILRLFVRGLDQYDPRFGDAFFDGRWNKNFNHAEALAEIQCPVLLVHANFTALPDGTLNGAMDQSDADRAMSLLAHGTYRRVESEHTVNIDKPKLFVELCRTFFLGKANP